jgi:hypothetical protein
MECAGELRTLIELGVPLAQGYFLSRPAAPWPSVPRGLLAPFASSVSRGARAGSGAPQRAERPSSAGRARHERV